jgi:hypothetical protein
MRRDAYWLLLPALLLAAGIADAQIIENAGFETGDFKSWKDFGCGWRVGSWVGEQESDAYEGRFGLINDISSACTDEWRGVSQEVLVRSWAHYAGGVRIRTFNATNSESYFEVQFLDVAGKIISHVQSLPATGTRSFTMTGLADLQVPEGAEKANVRAVVRLKGRPGGTPEFHVFDDFQFGTVHEMEALRAILTGKTHNR